MWKRNVAIGLIAVSLFTVALWAQRLGLPPGPMQEKARVACLGCHDARIILQQHLTRAGWTKNVDKMIRWGTPVAPEDRDALIDYLTQNFGPAASPEPPKLADGPGVEKVRAACLACHDAGPIVEQRLDRRGWTRVMERQVRWGAVVRAEDRDTILDYLVAHYGPGPSKPHEQK